MISIFDIYKIGVGPSSSHTVGPMKAGKRFVEELVERNCLHRVSKVSVDIYGSLSLTGKGHHTDIAIILGLAGHSPESVDIEAMPSLIEDVALNERLQIGSIGHDVEFPRKGGINFHRSNLSLHENGMQIHAWAGEKVIHSQTYYSTGGGFIVEESNFGKETDQDCCAPFQFNSADELVKKCNQNGYSISTLVLKNEYTITPQALLEEQLAQIWKTMKECMEKGMKTEGILPGPLKVIRRAPALFHHLQTTENLASDPMAVIDWVNMFAFAVNEENAAGGRVVTAPTNGACGIVPAVLAYYDKFIKKVDATAYTRYFSASAAIGGLYKQNASISGAEVGCQGEVGVACSMAAAGLAELMGGSPEQVCMAAEIAMEHNLGLTCDPVAGQVQVPCIERNGIAAVKAINSTRMALRRVSLPSVSLDKVMETMLATGKDMNAKYRETSLGGLAVKVLC